MCLCSFFFFGVCVYVCVSMSLSFSIFLLLSFFDLTGEIDTVLCFLMRYRRRTASFFFFNFSQLYTFMRMCMSTHFMEPLWRRGRGENDVRR